LAIENDGDPAETGNGDAELSDCGQDFRSVDECPGRTKPACRCYELSISQLPDSRRTEKEKSLPCAARPLLDARV